jgi:hypothetical protein
MAPFGFCNVSVIMTAWGSITVHRKLEKFGSFLHRHSLLTMPENDGAALIGKRTLSAVPASCVYLFLVAFRLRVAFG